MPVNVQALLKEGYFWDFRSGSFREWNDSGFDGVPSNVYHTGNGIRHKAGGGVTVADHPGLDITTGTLVFLGSVDTTIAADQILFYKGVSAYYLRTVSGLIRMFDGVTTTTLVAAGTYKLIGVNFSNGQAPSFYLAGNYAGDGDNAITHVANTDNLNIGRLVSSLENKGLTQAALIFPRTLTASEHAALADYLTTIPWPKESHMAADIPKESGPDDRIWQTMYGANTSIVSRTEQLENTPFKITGAGAKLIDGLYGNVPAKYIESQGNAANIYTHNGMMKQTPSEMAYGTWTGTYEKNDATGGRTVF
jgi:hypothetical protein